MPQSPFDFLKQAAMRNVPKVSRPSTEMETENQSFRGQAIQDADTNPFRKAGRHSIEALTGFLTNDPSGPPSEDQRKHLTNPATDMSQIGGIANLLPLMGGLKKAGGVAKSLPIIAPEAYTDVKAGGLRLYSRLTDAFAKAPKVMNPDKIRSVAKQGASGEEIGLRKLEQFLTGKQPMDKVNREDVMSHLASNPLELDVVRKGYNPATRTYKNVDDDVVSARRELDALQHQLETTYGNDWTIASITPEERTAFNAAEQRVNTYLNEIGELDADPGNTPRYDFMQTPGPKENYGESLINLPKSRELQELEAKRKLLDEDSSQIFNDPRRHDDQQLLIDTHRGAGHLQEMNNMSSQQFNELTNNEVFQSSHWEEPNNLVWSRHNDRRLNPTSTSPEVSELDPYGVRETYHRDATSQGGSKGRFVEEIQSDWHQQGRERGYIGDPYPEITVSGEASGQPNRYDFGASTDNHFGMQGRTEEEAIRRTQEAIDHARVPDAPFKDTYHELALKQQLLDAANDPELEWLGVADAPTVSQLEGHTSMMGVPRGIRPGTQLFYDEKHPSALEKLLKPLGGEVEYANLPGDPVNSIGVVDNPYSVAHFYGSMPDTNWGHQPIVANGEHYIANALTDNPREAQKKVSPLVTTNEVPGPGMWKASLPPELKELIKTRGFPAMAAFLALQQSLKPQEEQ